MGSNCSACSLEHETTAHIFMKDDTPFVVVGNYVSKGTITQEEVLYKSVFVGYQQDGFHQLIHHTATHIEAKCLIPAKRVVPKFCSHPCLELWFAYDDCGDFNTWFARFSDTGTVCRLGTDDLTRDLGQYAVHVSPDFNSFTVADASNKLVKTVDLVLGNDVPCSRVQACEHNVINSHSESITVHVDESARVFSVLPLVESKHGEPRFCSERCYNSLSMVRIPMEQTYFMYNGTLYLRGNDNYDTCSWFKLCNFPRDVPFTAVHRVRSKSEHWKEMRFELLILDGSSLVVGRSSSVAPRDWDFIQPTPFHEMRPLGLTSMEYFEVKHGEYIVVDRDNQVAYDVSADQFYDMTEKMWVDSRGRPNVPGKSSIRKDVIVLPNGQVVMLPGTAETGCMLLQTSWFLVNRAPLVQPFDFTTRFRPPRKAFFHGSNSCGWFLFSRTYSSLFKFYEGLPTTESSPSCDVGWRVVGNKVLIHYKQYAVLVTPYGCSDLLDHAVGYTLLHRGVVDSRRNIIRCKNLSSVPLTYVQNQEEVAITFLGIQHLTLSTFLHN